MIFRQSKNEGFSLVELIIAISIIGILSIAAVPYTMNWRASAKVNNVANIIMHDLLEAKSQSITHNVDVIVTFDLEEKTYRVYLDTNGAGIDISNLIKSVPLSSIDPGVTFGNIVNEDINGDDISQSVVMGTTTNPIRTILKPNGEVINAGAIYLVPTQNATVERQRAVEITSAGRVTRWTYVNDAWEELLYE